MIKPSHYDDDGYVIRWWRAMIPSNSLAALYGIAAECAERKVLGPDPWAYGLGDANRKNLQTVIRYCREQGLIKFRECLGR